MHTMTVLPFAPAAPSDVEPSPAEPARRESLAEPAAQPQAADVRQQVLDLKRKLEEAANESGRLLSSVTSQQQLEQLLAQGRALLQELRSRLQQITAERDRLVTQLAEREVAHKQFADERTEERFTFQRLLAEATANQRDMAQELDEQRQQIQTLREAATRAQSLARQIMRAHETVPSER